MRYTEERPLPYDYQYGMACMLYDKLAVGNVKLANKTHFHEGFKFYDFSNLLLSAYESTNEGLIFDNASFIITSPDPVFVQSFARGLLKQPEFQIYNRQFVIDEVEVLQQKKIQSPCTFKTLSPVFTKTMRERDDELMEWELYPSDGKFHENIHANLVDRYTEYHGEPPQHDYFEITSLDDFKAKRIRVGSGDRTTHRRCSLMTFTVQGSPKLLQFAYDAGIGEKNAMGFGCLDVVH